MAYISEVRRRKEDPMSSLPHSDNTVTIEERRTTKRLLNEARKEM